LILTFVIANILGSNYSWKLPAQANPTLFTKIVTGKSLRFFSNISLSFSASSNEKRFEKSY
jgi:hypothetical protein